MVMVIVFIILVEIILFFIVILVIIMVVEVIVIMIVIEIIFFIVVLFRRSEVNFNGMVSDFGIVYSFESSRGVVNGRELDVIEIFRGVSVFVGGEFNVLDVIVLVECFVDLVFGNRERKGIDLKSFGRRRLFVVEDFSMFFGGFVGFLLSGVINMDGMVVNFRIVFFNSFGRGFKVGEFYVVEIMRFLGVMVEDDLGRNNFIVRFEFGFELVVVDILRELVDENVGSGFFVIVIGFGFFCRGNRFFFGFLFVFWVILV